LKEAKVFSDVLLARGGRVFFIWQRREGQIFRGWEMLLPELI
jgi:hypothetical protein